MYVHIASALGQHTDPALALCLCDPLRDLGAVRVAQARFHHERVVLVLAAAKQIQNCHDQAHTNALVRSSACSSCYF